MDVTVKEFECTNNVYSLSELIQSLCFECRGEEGTIVMAFDTFNGASVLKMVVSAAFSELRSIN